MSLARYVVWRLTIYAENNRSIQRIPVEMEKLLTRPDISGHFSHLLSSQLTPLIDRHIKEAVTKTLIPVYSQQSSANSQQSSAMHQELLRELRNELHSFKSEMSSWQNETIRNQEVCCLLTYWLLLLMMI